ncbi:MAG TPA: UDP-N-acetylglucosamine 1-carboxyvinyltransferase, partial [Limnochordales bacterium]
MSLRVQGGARLSGELWVSGAKNSALAALVAAALGQEPVVLEGVPIVADVAVMVELLRALGVRVRVLARGEVEVDGRGLCSHEAPYELVRRMRASFYVSGLLLGALGRAVVPLPGGCALGSRPVDFHLKGFEQLGAQIEIQHGSMFAQAPPEGLRGAVVHLSRPSVGATIQLMMASCRARGATVIENAALEPEVVDVANLLNTMGARIRGAGTPVVHVQGVDELRGTRYRIIPDRIEAGTWLVAAAATGGEVSVKGALAEHLQLPLMKL